MQWKRWDGGAWTSAVRTDNWTVVRCEEADVMEPTVVWEIGHSFPTPIQQEAVPLVLTGGDVLAAAETGSGKTGVRKMAEKNTQLVVWERIRLTNGSLAMNVVPGFCFACPANCSRVPQERPKYATNQSGGHLLEDE